MTNSYHDALVIHSSKVVSFRKSNYLLSFLHYQSFCERNCHLFLQMGDILFGLKPILSPQTGLSSLFFTLVFIFLSLLFLSFHSGPRGRSIGLSDSQDPTCPSGLSQSATHSVSESVALHFSLNSVEVNSSRGGGMHGKKHFPFSHCSQMSILVFHTARHFPALSNRTASRSFQPMQKINDIIAT